MNFEKLICLTLCLILSVSLFAGCGSNEDYVLYFELDSAPKTLDPQLASETSEELLIKNLFEGLMRENSKGEIVKGVASDYTVSDDKKTYTFTIRDGAKWSDGVPVTGKDFVFAFERALDPKNKAPYVASLYSIMGAKDIAEGKKTKGLGITSLNDNTVTFELNSPDPNFLRTLTTSVCMPCRKDIYNNAKGQYGLVPERLVTNGSYKIRFWEKAENFSFRINKFTEYNGDFQADATAVIFNIGSISDRSVKIEEGNVDMGFVNISKASEKSNLFIYEKSSYVLLINKKSPLGSNDFRNAFAKSIHRNRLKNELGKSLKESDCLIPDTVLLNGASLSSKITVTAPPEYEPNEAHSLYITGANAVKDMPKKIDIFYYGEETKELALLVSENMQQALGAVVNAAETQSEAELLSLVSNENYTLAILPITATSSSPSHFFEAFTKNSNKNIYGFKSNKYDEEVLKITSDANESTIITASQTALKILISDITVIPLAMHLEGFAYGDDLTCPTISPFGGVIDLALVRKNK